MSRFKCLVLLASVLVGCVSPVCRGLRGEPLTRCEAAERDRLRPDWVATRYEREIMRELREIRRELKR